MTEGHKQFFDYTIYHNLDGVRIGVTFKPTPSLSLRELESMIGYLQLVVELAAQ
jgi:hypothetical protein